MRGPLLAVLTANLLSVTGTTMTTVAVPWFVLETTGSATRTGLAAAVSLAPVVISAGLGGALIDRLGYRCSSVLADLTSGVLVAAIPLLWKTVGLSYGVLLILLFARWLCATPGETAREALTPELARHAGTTLERGMTGLDGVSRAGKMLGAPLAGVLIAVFGAADLLYADAVSFAVSATLVGLAARTVAEPRQAVEGSYLRRLRDGLAFLWHDRLMRALVIMIALSNMLDAAYSEVLLPVYARDVLHSAVALGLISGVFSAGAVAGAVVFAVAGARLPRYATFVTAFMLGGGPRFLVLALHLPMPGTLGLLAVLALGVGAINPLLGVIMVERAPAHLRARVIGATTACAWAAMPLGGLLGGALTGLAGIEAALAIGGGLYLLISFSPLVGRTWRTMGRGPAEPVTEAAGRAS